MEIQALEYENEHLRAQLKAIKDNLPIHIITRIMRQADNFIKLKAAGFRIIRPDDQPSPRIKEWKSDGAWATIEKFDTKANRDRRLESLLMDPRIITE